MDKVNKVKILLIFILIIGTNVIVGRKILDFNAPPPFPVFEQHFHSFLLQHQESPTFNFTNYADYYFDSINLKVREDYYEGGLIFQSNICHFGEHGCGGVGWDVEFAYDAGSSDNATCSFGYISEELCQGTFEVSPAAVYEGTFKFENFPITYKWSCTDKGTTESFYVYYLDKPVVAIPVQIEYVTSNTFAYNRFLTYFAYNITQEIFTPFSFCPKNDI